MRETRYENSKNKKNVETLMELIQQNIILMEYIEKEYLYEDARVEVLKKILMATNTQKIKEMEQEIFLYGSMTKGKDLIARQMFLWLMGMVSDGSI